MSARIGESQRDCYTTKCLRQIMLLGRYKYPDNKSQLDCVYKRIFMLIKRNNFTKI